MSGEVEIRQWGVDDELLDGLVGVVVEPVPCHRSDIFSDTDYCDFFRTAFGDQSVRAWNARSASQRR
jgi:WD40 repeat protein